MLPAGFQWLPYLDGPALFVAGRVVAMASAIPTGQWRLAIGVGFRSPRYEFFDDEATAVRYAGAWARRWESEIRREAGITPVRGWDR